MADETRNGDFKVRVVRLLGHRDDAGAWEIRDFLKRSVVESQWIELSTEEDCRRELGLDLKNVNLPVVELPDGTRLFGPTLRDVADRLGFLTKPKRRQYDVSIYGAGPAGLSAAVYAASEGLSTVLIERSAVGGQAGTTSMIENYMGFPQGINGADLAERARQQAVKFGVELVMMQEGVKSTFHDDRIWTDLADGGTMVARANVCATGVEWRRLNLANEDKLLGRGLYYGAGASEAPLCGGEDVYVVGGGNSAGQAVMHLATHAKSVTMLVRDKALAASMSQYLSDRILGAANVQVRYDVEITGLDGGQALERVRNRLAHDKGSQLGDDTAAVRRHRRRAQHRLGRRHRHRPRSRRLSRHRSRPPDQRQGPSLLASGPRALLPGDLGPGLLRRRRCAPPLHQARRHCSR